MSGKHWFLPATPDVLGILGRQVDITVGGFASFSEWAKGSKEAVQQITDAEHEANDVRRELARELKAAFSTPLPQEDVLSLSERLSAVLRRAKNVVRETQLLDVKPDLAVVSMAAAAQEGVSQLAVGMTHLVGDNDVATAAADAAIQVARRMEKIYRKAMSELLTEPDLRMVLGQREMYRRSLEVGERIDAAAERIWYAVVKES